MNAFTRCVLLMIALLALSTSEVPGVIKATSPLKLFVRDGTQIVQVRVTKFDPENNRLVFEVEQDIKGKLEHRSMNVVWKVEPDSKWEGIRTLPRLLKCFGPDQQAILFINDAGGFWHNKGSDEEEPHRLRIHQRLLVLPGEYEAGQRQTPLEAGARRAVPAHHLQGDHGRVEQSAGRSPRRQGQAAGAGQGRTGLRPRISAEEMSHGEDNGHRITRTCCKGSDETSGTTVLVFRDPAATTRAEVLEELRHLSRGGAYSLPVSKSTTQQPLTCGPGPRQWLMTSSLSQPASIRASARIGMRS